MSERKVPINENVVVIGDGGSPEEFNLVVCLTSNSFDLSIAEVTGESKCGTDYAPGTISATLNIEGLIILDPYNGRTSAAALFLLAQGKTEFNFKYGPLSPISGDVTYEGRGFFTAYNNTEGTNEYDTFSGTIRVVQRDGIDELLTQTVTP